MTDSRLSAQFENLKNINIVEALMPAGNILKMAAVEIVPVDTGHLRDSIVVEELPPSENGVFVMAGAGEYDVNYANFVEFGNNNPNYPIQPYMRPAIDNNELNMRAAAGANIVRQMQDLIRSA